MESGSDFIHLFEAGSGDRTLLLLHGTGGSERDLLPLGRDFAPDANLLSPRGQVSENGMPRFFRRLAEGVLDVPDLKERTGQLALFLEQAASEYGFSPARTVAVGFSNGANIASSLLLLRPGLIAGACLLRPMIPYPFPHGLDLAGTRVLICAGGRDPLIPTGEPERLADSFREAGAEVEFSLDPDAGHGLARTDLAAGKAWFAAKP